ncbi:SUMF1/EgtB/PvdO family nonheme iron enzyme [Candidatus Hydrogenedentota bacterium]
MLYRSVLSRLSAVLMLCAVLFLLTCSQCAGPTGEGTNSLNVSKASIDFGGVSTTASDSFQIVGTGDGELTYSLSCYEAETSFTPDSGSVSGDGQTIAVTIDLSRFESGLFGIPSIYADVITVESSDGQESVEVFATKVEGAMPVISYVVPNYGDPGDSVTLRGANFITTEASKAAAASEGQTAPRVYFDEIEATVKSYDGTTIDIDVPPSVLSDASRDYEVTVVAGIEESDPAPVDFTGSDETIRPLSVSGHIYVAGSPLSGATVELRDGAGTSFTAATDTNGDFAFASVPPIGTYIARCSADDYRSRTVTVALIRDTTAVIDLLLTALGGEAGEVAVGEMVDVAAGSFEMGRRDSGDDGEYGTAEELPRHNISLDAYAIGKYEVTNREYADILKWAKGKGYIDSPDAITVTAYGQELLDLDSGECQIAYVSLRYVVDSRDGYSMEDHPVVDVTWYGAVAYCNWLSEVEGLDPCYNTTTWECDFAKNGYRLPTEAEWERAAAWDGSKHWIYEFQGDSLDSGRANYSNNNPKELSSIPYTAPIGYYDGSNSGTEYSVSPVGCYDMAGNVWEWCHDRHDATYYDTSPENNPTGPSIGSYRILRGGAWDSFRGNLRSAARYRNFPTETFYTYGFRLARNN